MSLTSCWSQEEAAFHKMCNVTHILLVIGKGAACHKMCKDVQCHSQTVGHRKICDETVIYRRCNTTHFLLVIGEDEMRLPFTKCVTHKLLVIGRDMMRVPFTKCAPHSLLVIGKSYVMRLPFKKYAMSLTSYQS